MTTLQVTGGRVQIGDEIDTGRTGWLTVERIAYVGRDGYGRNLWMTDGRFFGIDTRETYAVRRDH